MSVAPFEPTSFQPRSSATIWTMFGWLVAAIDHSGASQAKLAMTDQTKSFLTIIKPSLNQFSLRACPFARRESGSQDRSEYARDEFAARFR